MSKTRIVIVRSRIDGKISIRKLLYFCVIIEAHVFFACCVLLVLLDILLKNFKEQYRIFVYRRFLIVLCCLVIGVICTIGEYEEKITQKFIYVV